MTSHDAIDADRVLIATFAPWLSTDDRARYRLPRAMASTVEEEKRERLTRLMKEYGKMVFQFCLWKLKHRAAAEDVLQQVFIEAYRDLDRFQGLSKESTWLIGIAKHRCQDASKSKKRRGLREKLDEQAVDGTIDPEPDLPSLLDDSRISKMLAECLEGLPVDTRKVVFLRFQDGMSYEDMAHQLGIKADTLRARVARALPFIRQCLEAKGVEL